MPGAVAQDNGERRVQGCVRVVPVQGCSRGDTTGLLAFRLKRPQNLVGLHFGGRAVCTAVSQVVDEPVGALKARASDVLCRESRRQVAQLLTARQNRGHDYQAGNGEKSGELAGMTLRWPAIAGRALAAQRHGGMLLSATDWPHGFTGMGLSARLCPRFLGQPAPGSWRVGEGSTSRPAAREALQAAVASRGRSARRRGGA